MTEPSPFEQLLQAANAQAEPQRLLFVFATAELPADATVEQRERFERGQGGTLTPAMCVDKAPEELPSFDALVTESRRAGPAWQVVFAAGLSGSGGQAPSQAQVDRAMEALVERVRTGQLGGLMALNEAGETLDFG